MKPHIALLPDSLRPLFLAIARASAAEASAERLAEGQDGGAQPCGASAIHTGPLRPGYDAAVVGGVTFAADGTLAPDAHIDLKESLCAIGRRPAGLRSGATGGRTRIGAFLARAAHLEAASVQAFYKLVRELRVLGAPGALRDGVLDAMLDEVRHAQDVGELARAYGGEIARPHVETTGLRSAYEMALDNVAEGCVRETFGALQATYQAETAADPRVRGLMAQIAQDESRHAELAWQLQAWLEPRLSEPERTQVAAERARVLDTLAADLEVELSREEYATLGFPTPDVSRGLLRGLSQALYA
jgi:hypothetical protein